VGRIATIVGHRRLPWLAAGLAALILAPALGLGLFLDDLTHRWMMQGKAREVLQADPRWALFKFVASPEEVRVGVQEGYWPWWTTPDFRLAFMRPLSSLSHALDYRWLELPPWVMHAENIAIYVGVVLVVAALARRLVGGLGAGIATLAFALDDAHAMPVGWIANRNALFATLFGLGAVLSHVRADREGWRAGRVVGPVLFALGLASGEVATGALAYLAAYALVLDERPWPVRARALAPYGALTVGWAVLYKALGYGAAAGAFYIDPVGQPGAFARAVVVRLPVLIGAQLGPLPSDVLANAPASATVTLACCGLALVTVLVASFWPLTRDPVARFGALGTLLALVPTCAVFPSDRSLLISGLGASVLVGRLVAWTFEERRRLDRRALAWGLVGVHLILAPLLVPARLYALHAFAAAPIRRAAQTFPAGAEGKTLVVLGAPDPLVLSFMQVLGEEAGRAPPVRLRLLAIAVRGEHTCRRVDDRRLEMTLSEGFIQEPIGAMFRGPDTPMHVGDEVHVDGFDVKVLDVLPDGRARTVVFTFAEPLESPSYAWMTWKGKGFSAVTPPPPGASLSIAPTPLAEAYGP
jgi:hypothetical protein